MEFPLQKVYEVLGPSTADTVTRDLAKGKIKKLKDLLEYYN